MEEQELKNIWKRSSIYEEITINTSKLMKDFTYKMEQRERIVRNRDYRETIGAIASIFLFGYLTYYTPSFVSKIGGISLIGSYIYYIFKLRANRKSKHTQKLFLSITEQLQQQKQFMLNQATLLGSVLYWMVIPIFISYLIFVWSIGDSLPIDTPDIVLEVLPIKLGSKVLWSSLMGIFCIYTVWLNKQAAKVSWKPLIKDIDTILYELKNKN